HKGSFRALLDEAEVDEVVDCQVRAVCECGAPVLAEGRVLRHQVFEVPPLKARVEEYRLHGGRCSGCGRRHRAVLPAGVPTGQLGPRALALIGTLATRYQMSQHKIRELLADVMGLRFSIGAVSQAHGLVGAALKAPVDEAVRSLAAAPLKHMDETSYGREGQRSHWVWALVQPRLAVFSVLPSRARYVIHSLLGAQPRGIVSSDRYAGYAHIPAGQRQLCWAHLLRDFRRIAERQGAPGVVGRWLLATGHVLFRWRQQGRAPQEFAPLQRRLRQTLQRGVAQTACRRTAATCAELLKWWPSLWTFLRCPEVAPTNNDAERALRAVVVKRKISGPTRSKRGDEFLSRGFTAHESCRRQNRDLLQYLVSAVTAWISKLTPPSLLPQPAG
ncbi:IS66 family transposase, partial [Caldimonas tepidiphila]|uniref:IS66 family transposase n=1 Tax=Caldimonas tepidiphila TaxID=2315841 RepID=UPI000E5B2C1E